MNTTNGATKQLPKAQSTNGKTVSTVTKIEPPKKEEQKTELPKQELPSIVPLPKQDFSPIEDRFLKLDVLFSKREKWERIKDSLDKLNKFKLSTDGRSDNITLKDGAGNSFSTYNAEVLSTVVDLLKVDLTKKLADVEQEINL
jgi:hypothetical protein